MVKWQSGKWAKWAYDFYSYGNPDESNFVQKKLNESTGKKDWLAVWHGHAMGRRDTLKEAQQMVVMEVKVREEMRKDNRKLNQVMNGILGKVLNA